MITATGANTGVGIAGVNVTVTNNTGIISGGLSGINAGAGTATVNNSHNITGFGTTGFGFGIVASTVDVTNNSSGVIAANGSGGTAIDGFNVTVSNAGSVQADAANGIAIFGATTLRVDNTGNITAGGTAIEGNGTTVINNLGAGSSISASNFGIFANNAATTITNERPNPGNRRHRVPVRAGFGLNLTNSGLISGGAAGTGINAGSVTAINSGTISGGDGAFRRLRRRTNRNHQLGHSKRCRQRRGWQRHRGNDRHQRLNRQVPVNGSQRQRHLWRRRSHRLQRRPDPVDRCQQQRRFLQHDSPGQERQHRQDFRGRFRHRLARIPSPPTVPAASSVAWPASARPPLRP